MKIYLPLIFVLFCFTCKNDEVAVSDCASSGAEERGSRTIGYDILDVTEKGDFGANYAIASGQLRSEFIQLLQPWSAFENNQQGVFDGEAIATFQTLNGFAESTGTKLSLIVTPIDIPGRFTPAYLENRKFDDPQVIASFNSLIDKLFNPGNGIVNPKNVIAFSVGNEIDQYNWTDNNDKPSAYKAFLQAIKPKINSYGIPLHFTGTLYGLDQAANTWKDLADVVDKISVTYYPLNGDFTVRSPEVIHSDFDSFFSKFGNQSVFLQEVGYPSSATLKSSEEKQAEFFCNFFSAWDKYIDRISHTSVLRLNDVSPSSAQATGVDYGLASNSNFIEYIRTLGIRTWNDTGTNKKAYAVITEQLNRRNW